MAMVSAGCGRAGAAHGEQASESGPAVKSYADFLDDVRHAKYAAYQKLPGARVASRADFEDMRHYILTRTDPSRVVDSVVSHDAVFDCVATDGSTASAPSPAAPPGGGSGGSGSGATTKKAKCPQGSIPTRRVTLEDLVKFATLDDFNGKHP
jgi:hypothetical protein